MKQVNRNVGLYCAVGSALVYLLLNIFLVFRLPKILDTFLVFSWVFVPGIIGSLIFYVMDKKGRWDES